MGAGQGPLRERFPVVIVGGGQAGLAAGYHLQRLRIRHLILDAGDRIGDSWRGRWASLRLFTPARIDGLPGLPFPAGSRELPGKDAMAGYLEKYAAHFSLPVRSGVRVTRLEYVNDRYLLGTTTGDIEADQVIVATGANQTPRVPTFASQLAPGIKQMTAADYRDPSQLSPGGVLVVGAGNSGSEIALEVAREHPTWLSGRSTGTGSPKVFSRPGWWVAQHILTKATPPGRRMHASRSMRGAPLLRITREDFMAAGVERVARMIGVEGGRPRLEDGAVLDVSSVVWCTGFGQDFRWIHVPVFDERGDPVHVRGVVKAQPGLYFVGLPFLHGITSALIGGVSRDARHIAKNVARRTASYEADPIRLRVDLIRER